MTADSTLEFKFKVKTSLKLETKLLLYVELCTIQHRPRKEAWTQYMVP